MGLVIYKGNLLNPIEWGFDRKKIEKYAFFESKNLERKKRFFSKQKFLVAASEQPSVDLKFESNPSPLTIPNNSLTHLPIRAQNEAFALDIERAPAEAIIYIYAQTKPRVDRTSSLRS